MAGLCVHILTHSRCGWQRNTKCQGRFSRKDLEESYLKCLKCVGVIIADVKGIISNPPVSEYRDPSCPLSMSDLVITKKVKMQRVLSKGRDIRERARAQLKANRLLKA